MARIKTDLNEEAMPTSRNWTPPLHRTLMAILKPNEKLEQVVICNDIETFVCATDQNSTIILSAASINSCIILVSVYKPYVGMASYRAADIKALLS